jgi:hypothetical protein
VSGSSPLFGVQSRLNDFVFAVPFVLCSLDSSRKTSLLRLLRLLCLLGSDEVAWQLLRLLSTPIRSFSLVRWICIDDRRSGLLQLILQLFFLLRRLESHSRFNPLSLSYRLSLIDPRSLLTPSFKSGRLGLPSSLFRPNLDVLPHLLLP